ncbi:hypothetical protein RJ641_006886 [Dillenia turbinata]|uniref:Uncharacterized protein n=1 Tax=Dillenia turbinata TaxID=194707 RepID=A0AAN8V699_9MAGN
MARLSKDCVDDNWNRRPDMSKVVLRPNIFRFRVNFLPSISLSSGKCSCLGLLRPPIILTKLQTNLTYMSLEVLESNWVIGGLLPIAEQILLPFSYIVQAQILKEYPSELVVTFFNNLFMTLVAGVIGLLAEPNPDARTCLPNVALAAILYFVSVLTARTQSELAKLQLIIKSDYPIVIGTTIITTGFYAVLWGKANEGVVENCKESLEASSSQKTPFLENPSINEYEKVLVFKGISYSSALSSAISNLLLASALILAVIFRLETEKMRSSNRWAKIVGAIVSIAGALVVILYRRPTVIMAIPPSTCGYIPLEATQSSWNTIQQKVLLVKYEFPKFFGEMKDRLLTLACLCIIQFLDNDYKATITININYSQDLDQFVS